MSAEDKSISPQKDMRTRWASSGTVAWVSPAPCPGDEAVKLSVPIWRLRHQGRSRPLGAEGKDRCAKCTSPPADGGQPSGSGLTAAPTRRSGPHHRPPTIGAGDLL